MEVIFYSVSHWWVYTGTFCYHYVRTMLVLRYHTSYTPKYSTYGNHVCASIFIQTKIYNHYKLLTVISVLHWKNDHIHMEEKTEGGV